MAGKWIRLFEHQQLTVGQPVEGGVFEERHWQKLRQFLHSSRYPYFQLLPQGVRFRQYVGVLQVDELTIEIVPKTDREQDGQTGPWQRVLLDILQECRLWRGEWIAGSGLSVQRGALLEWYVRFFLDQTEKLLRKGLRQQYNRRQDKQPALRGRLLLHRQIVENQPRFWTEHESYDFDHPHNQWLAAALDLIAAHDADDHLRRRAQALRQRFPALSGGGPLPDLPLQIRDRDYQSALIIAQLLLRHFAPVARRGNWPLLAILFDMNALFEEYIARQLERSRPPGAKVMRQLAAPFWNRRTIRPDLALEWQDRRIVVDTKWKIMPSGQPAMEDLRQIYVYNEYFSADQGVLLYPKSDDFLEWPAIPFALVRHADRAPHACRVLAAPVICADGRLNRSLGAELWERLIFTAKTQRR